MSFDLRVFIDCEGSGGLLLSDLCFLCRDSCTRINNYNMKLELYLLRAKMTLIALRKYNSEVVLTIEKNLPSKIN